MSLFRRFWSCFDYKIGFLHHLSSTLKSILLLFFKVSTCLYILTYIPIVNATFCTKNAVISFPFPHVGILEQVHFCVKLPYCSTMHAVSFFCSNFSQLYSMTEYCLTCRVIDNLRVRVVKYIWNKSSVVLIIFYSINKWWYYEEFSQKILRNSGWFHEEFLI